MNEKNQEQLKEACFNASDGLAENEVAEKLTREAVIKALRLAELRLAEIVAGQHGDCVVEIKGVGGNYARGNPRLGVNPKSVSYDDLSHIELLKSHTSEGTLIQEVGYSYPSDVDLSLIFKRKDGSRKTIGDEVVLSAKIREVLKGIYDETGVFISPHDRDPMKIRSVEEIIAQLS